MEFKYVTMGDVDFEDVKKLQNFELEDMADEIEEAAKQAASTFAAAKEQVRLDLKRRADEALESLRRIGALPPAAAIDAAAAEEKAMEKARKKEEREARKKAKEDAAKVQSVGLANGAAETLGGDRPGAM